MHHNVLVSVGKREHIPACPVGGFSLPHHVLGHLASHHPISRSNHKTGADIDTGEKKEVAPLGIYCQYLIYEYPSLFYVYMCLCFPLCSSSSPFSVAEEDGRGEDKDGMTGATTLEGRPRFTVRDNIYQ